MPSTSSLSQLQKKYSSCMALYSLTRSPFLGNAPLSRNIPSGDVPQTFLCHESSRFELIPQPAGFFSCSPPFLSFDLPIHCFLGRNPSFCQNLKFASAFSVLFSARLLRLAAVHQFGSHFLSCITRVFSAPNHNFSLPVHSSYHIASSLMLLFLHVPKNCEVSRSCALSSHLHVLATPSTPHTSILVGLGTPFGSMPYFWTNTSALCTFLASSRTCYSFHTSYIDTCWPGHTIQFDALFTDKYVGPVHFPRIMYLMLLPHLIHRYLLARAHHSVRCFISSLFLSTKVHYSFGCGRSSSQSFHSSTMQ